MIKYFYQYEDQTELSLKVSTKKILQDLNVFDDKWTQYNKTKPWIQRQGLCIINEKGSVGPGPALDSLFEWNKINNTNLVETDFNKPTEVYNHSEEVRKVFKDILPYSVRSHFLKLSPGGYFPPHRDHIGKDQKTFRLVIPIDNVNPPHTRFMIEDRTLYWNLGKMYLLNTTKQHMLFNAAIDKDSIWLVINCLVCDEMIDYVNTNLAIR